VSKTNKKLHFYIIDEDPDTLDFIRELLEAEGHKVTSGTDNAAALPEIISQKPDCITTNLMMPGMDGLELCKELRSHKALDDSKIFVITSKAYEYDHKRSLEFGANGFIRKPIKANTFIPEINRILEDKVHVTFWGVRGTLPVPGEYSLKYGGHTSCVTMEFPKGQFFIFDGGTGIKSLSDKLMSTAKKRINAKIFISHPHWDHINAIPFFVPLYIQGNVFEIYGSSNGDLTMEQMISAQMDGVYFPITIQEFASSVSFVDLKEETFEIDDITIKTMLLSHPGYCLGYRVEYNDRAVCYITDNELFHEDDEFYDPSYVRKLTRFVEGADILITDTTFTDAEYATKVGWGHSAISEVVNLAHDANVKTLCLFHHDPDQKDDDIDTKFEIAKQLLADLNSKTVCLAPHAKTSIKV
jgi:phosphoribosyl 1,2-cyclic phosphodiesterase/CheY-like chemotaxis protein